MIHLRLVAPGNAQPACITLASDVEFAGAIAQLGERLSGTQEVAGSSPASSTPESGAVPIGAHEFRERFGCWIERAAQGDAIAVTRGGKPFVSVTASAPQLEVEDAAALSVPPRSRTAPSTPAGCG
jgi:antitoxin (DNA-binding transcriptional repressor) of toxin-antitoxin stability system